MFRVRTPASYDKTQRLCYDAVAGVALHERRRRQHAQGKAEREANSLPRVQKFRRILKRFFFRGGCQVVPPGPSPPLSTISKYRRYISAYPLIAVLNKKSSPQCRA